MAKKAERGTKRTCQNSECGSRFYDLNRDPIVCPICQTVYRIASAPVAAATAATAAAAAAAAAAVAASEEKAARKAKKPEPERAPAQPSKSAPQVEGDSESETALVSGEGEDRPIAAQTDETFFEPNEEEDGGDVSVIIGGQVAEDEEEA